MPAVFDVSFDRPESLLATLVGFVVSRCRVFIDSWPAMNLVMQWPAPEQPLSAESEKWNPCTVKFWDRIQELRLTTGALRTGSTIAGSWKLKHGG